MTASKVLNRLKAKTDVSVHTNHFAYGKKKKKSQRRKHNYPKFKIDKSNLDAPMRDAICACFSSTTKKALLWIWQAP